ncbi:MAG: hypothetical protein ACM33B_08580 [Pseudomonadota bacterium]
MDHDDLLTQIHALIAASAAPADAAVLARMEDTLTVGYARALALEAERWRLERRIGELAAGLATGSSSDAGDLATLARRMSDTDAEVVRLRAALASLRDRASELRSAA